MTARFFLPVRVYYEDTDSGGVVYYANYLKFMERARSEWLRGFGIEQDELARDAGVIFAVSEVALSYKKPARFNDLLQVSVDLSHHRRASLEFRQAVLRDDSEDIVGEEGTLEADCASSTVLCSGTIKIACIDNKTFRPKRIPENCLAEILSDN